MKKLFTILLAVFISASIFAQSPQKISYQAVIRDASSVLITSTLVGMQISILQGSPTGTLVYVETQTPTSNVNGLVSIEIGGGIGFDTINWANGPYFIKTETDPLGGNNYTISGSSQLLSVPYALHAKTAENITGGIIETDPVYGSSVASGITGTDITNWNNKLDTEVDGSVTNELQALTISNDTVYLTNGGFVKLPAGFDGQYSNLLGAPTNVSSFTNDAGYLTSEVDGSVTNELQAITISNDTVYLTNGGFVKLPAGFDGQYSNLTGVPTNVSSFTNDAGYLTSEVDGSVTNELQAITISNDTVYLTNGGFVKLPPTNAWSLTGNTGTNPSTNFIGTKDANDFAIKTNNTEKMRISSLGKVGIGTAGTTFPLEVSVPSTNGSQFNLKLTNLTLGIGNGVGILFAPDDAAIAKMGIFVERKAAWGFSTMHFLSRLTSDYASADLSNSVMSLTQNGYLGIGTTTPSSVLNVRSSSYNLLKLETTGANSNVNIDIATTGGGKAQFTQTGGTGGFSFYPNGVVGNPTLAIVPFGTTGNVGIGTTSPATKLDVNGVITATGGTSTDWNNSYSWGNHALAGYLTAEVDGSTSNEIQTLSLSNDTVYLTNGGFVKIPEQKSVPALISQDDFSCTALKNYWSSSIAGTASIALSNSQAVLSTASSSGVAKLYSNKQKSVTNGKLVFTAVTSTYEDNNNAYGPLVRGLVNGIDRNNAIEFINISGNTIQARTVSGGIATTTNYSVGASVLNYYSYTIIASNTKVEFYFDGTLIATHTTNIPTLPLNMYFDASTWSGNVPQSIDDAKFEIIKY